VVEGSKGGVGVGDGETEGVGVGGVEEIGAGGEGGEDGDGVCRVFCEVGMEEDEHVGEKRRRNVEDNREMAGRVSLHAWQNPNPRTHSAGHQHSSGVARHDDAPV